MGRLRVTPPLPAALHWRTLGSPSTPSSSLGNFRQRFYQFYSQLPIYKAALAVSRSDRLDKGRSGVGQCHCALFVVYVSLLHTEAVHPVCTLPRGLLGNQLTASPAEDAPLVLSMCPAVTIWLQSQHSRSKATEPVLLHLALFCSLYFTYSFSFSLFI